MGEILDRFGTSPICSMHPPGRLKLVGQAVPDESTIYQDKFYSGLDVLLKPNKEPRMSATAPTQLNNQTLRTKGLDTAHAIAVTSEDNTIKRPPQISRQPRAIE